MPSKSRRKKGKATLYAKKKGKINHPPATVQQKSATLTKKSAPAASMPISETKQAVVRYPHLASELRTIGILALIMIIILVILALVPLPW